MYKHVCVCLRVKKLKETLVTVQQLDKNMSNLRSWLSRIEAELSRPITYSVCHHHEIQRRLAEQQVHRKHMQPHIYFYYFHFSNCDISLVVLSLCLCIAHTF